MKSLCDYCKRKKAVTIWFIWECCLECYDKLIQKNIELKRGLER